MASSSSSPVPSPATQSQRLSGKVALITGGASGIGESIARLFHKHGAKLCIVDLQDNLGDRLCQSLGGGPNGVYYLHCDVTNEEHISRAVDFAAEKFGTIDILVNNAGITGPPCSDIRDAKLSDYELVFDVNVKGTFLG